VDFQKYTDYPKEIDIVISGGGFLGFYLLGVDKVLRKLKSQGNLKIKRFAGCSVGAICSVLMCCEVPSELVYETLFGLTEDPHFFLHLKDQLLKILPKNAYQICNDRVFIVASRITRYGVKKTIFSTYESNEDLVYACLASSNFPIIVNKFLYFYHKDEYFIDGCFTDSLPIFQDTNRRQFIIKLYNLPVNNIVFFFKHLSIDGLIIQGTIDTDLFFKDKYRHEVLGWINHENDITKNRQRNHKYFYMIVGGIFTFSILCTCTIKSLIKKSKS
jgi:predicted acylesterase/phospholipase RssA